MPEINRRNISIRRITTDDLAAIYRLGVETSSGCSPYPPHPWEPEYIAGILAKDLSLSFAVTSGKKLIAFLIGRIIDDAGTPVGEILWYGIINDFQHDSVRGMFETFRDAAVQRGAKKMIAFAPDQCQDIINMIEKYGFTKRSSVFRYDYTL